MTLGEYYSAAGFYDDSTITDTTLYVYSLLRNEGFISEEEYKKDVMDESGNKDYNNMRWEKHKLTAEEITFLNQAYNREISQADISSDNNNQETTVTNEKNENPSEKPTITFNNEGKTTIENYCETYGLNERNVFATMKDLGLVGADYYSDILSNGIISNVELNKAAVNSLNNIYNITTTDTDTKTDSEPPTTTSSDNAIVIKYEEFDAARNCNKEYKSSLRNVKEHLNKFDSKITDDVFYGLAADKSHEIIKLINNAIEIYAEDLMHRMNVFLNKAEDKYKKADQNAANKS